MQEERIPNKIRAPAIATRGWRVNEETGGDRPNEEAQSSLTDDALELLATSRTGVDMSRGEQSSSGRDTFELLATILLALAAILTAWAGFQAAKWGGVQASNTAQAGAARTESVRASTLAGQQATVDVATFLNWVNAIVDDLERGEIQRPDNAADYEPTPGTLSGFLFSRFRDEFTPALSAWLDTDPFRDQDAPGTPFEMPEYQLAAAVEADRLQTEASEKTALAAAANQNGDNYVVSAVLFAAALFFAALSGKLTKDRYKSAALIVAALLFIGTVVYVFTLPIEV